KLFHEIVNLYPFELLLAKIVKGSNLKNRFEDRTGKFELNVVERTSDMIRKSDGSRRIFSVLKGDFHTYNDERPKHAASYKNYELDYGYLK
uniref:Uncharacterized protein n=1 Tax=Romanomermis culicivorax TaxID=13658 RepID=A0A915IY38_ROMCU